MLVLGRAFKTLGGLIGILTVYVAMPAGFAIFGHNPLDALKAVAATPFMHDDGTLFLAGATVFGWITWAYFALGFLTAIVGKLSGRNLRLPGFGPAQALATLMLAAITTTAAAPALSSARTVATVSHAQARPAIVISAPEHAAQDHDAPAESHLQVADNAVTHQVQNRETLLDLAERYYGDPDAASRITDANLGVVQPDGRSLQQGHTRIYPGWTLTIPAPTVHLAEAAPASMTLAASTSSTAAPVYQTQRGDYLWHIADRYLGDPERYPEIAACNPDLISDPDEIEPGWQLTLPAEATDRGARTHATGSLLEQQTNDAPAETPQPQPNTPVIDDGPAVAVPQPSHTTVPHQTPSQPHTTPERPSGHTAAPAEQPGAEHDQNRSAVHLSLSSGGWITGGLMVALATAWFLVRRQRARFRRPEFPINVTHDTSEPKQPSTVRGIAEAGLADRYEHQLTEDDATWRPGTVSSVGIDARGNEVSLHHHLGGATALTGPANAYAARAIIAATLATSIRHHGPERADLTIDAFTITQLLHGQHAPQLARLIVTASAERTAAALEREVLHRSRTLASNDAESIDAINADPDLDPIDGFVVIIPADARTDARVHAAAEQGRALGITVIILGTTSEAATAHIERGGTVVAEPGHAEHPTLHGGRIASLTDGDLVAVLRLLGEAEDTPQPDDATDGPILIAAVEDEPATAESENGPAPAADPQTLAPIRVAEIPVTLALLGTPSLNTAKGGEIVNGTRGRTFPLLAFLASHPNQDHSLEEIAFQLEPDADLESTKNILRTTISLFRKALRTGTENDERYLIQERYRYRINPELVEVDLWRMHAHLADANRAEDDASALAALTAAVACYRGDFATGFHHLWITDRRTTYRNQVVDALSRIAAIHEADQPHGALAALERAYEIEEPHGVNEPLIQTIMRIQGRIGRHDSVKRTMQLLRDRLWADAQRAPDPATERIYARMINRQPVA